MPKVPDYIENKNAKVAQGWLIGIGIFSGLVSFGAFSNGDGAFGFKAALLAVVLIWIGGSIKTRKKYVGGTGVYK